MSEGCIHLPLHYGSSGRGKWQATESIYFNFFFTIIHEESNAFMSLVYSVLGGRLPSMWYLSQVPPKLSSSILCLTSLSKTFYSLSYTLSIPLKTEKYKKKRGEIGNKKDTLGASWEQNPLHISHFLLVEKGRSLLDLSWVSKSRHNSYELGRWANEEKGKAMTIVQW